MNAPVADKAASKAPALAASGDRFVLRIFEREVVILDRERNQRDVQDSSPRLVFDETFGRQAPDEAVRRDVQRAPHCASCPIFDEINAQSCAPSSIPLLVIGSSSMSFSCARALRGEGLTARICSICAGMRARAGGSFPLHRSSLDRPLVRGSRQEIPPNTWPRAG
jgi:hypothetical protein